MSPLESILSDLERLTPMPEDNALTADMLKRYDTVLEELSDIRDPRMIQPLLKSLGYGTGFGVYWRAVHLLERFSWNQLEPALSNSLTDENPGTRMWSLAIITRAKPKKPRIVADVIKLLSDDHELVRAEAVKALDAIGGPQMRKYIEPLASDPSLEVRASVEQALKK